MGAAISCRSPVSIPEMVRLIVICEPFFSINNLSFNSRDGAIDRPCSVCSYKHILVSIPEMVRLIDNTASDYLAQLNSFNSRDGAIDRRQSASLIAADNSVSIPERVRWIGRPGRN